MQPLQIIFFWSIQYMCFSHLINPRHLISCTVVTSVVCCGGGGGGGSGSSQQMWQSGFRICNLKGNFITCSVILFTSCLIQIQCFHCLHTDASECNFIGFPSSSCNLKISSWLQRGKILKSFSNTLQVLY